MLLHHVLRVPVRPIRVGMPDLRFVAAVRVRRPSKGRSQIGRGIVRRCHRYASVYVKKLGLVTRTPLPRWPASNLCRAYRPGRRVVTSWINQLLPSGSLNEANEP